MTDLFSGDQQPAPARRQSSRVRAAKRRARRRRNVISFFVMITALALLISGGLVLVVPLLDGNEQAVQASSDYPGPGEGEVQVEIPEGASGRAMARALAEADVVASSSAFVAAFTAHPKANTIQPGTHVLMKKMKADDAVAAMVDGSTLADSRITIPEGWRATQIYERVAQRLEVKVDAVEKAAKKLSESALPKAANGEIEGWLAAGTYNVGPGDKPQDVLKSMIDRTNELMESLGVASQDRQDVLTKASIVEAEVIRDDERSRVALVIENRLDNCSNDGRLGMDSTVSYGLGISLGEALTQERLEEDTPYNTRLYPGLPPGPINSPSKGSVEAVLAPAKGDLCYFVSDLNTGKSLFGATLEEHEENKETIRKRNEGG